MTIVSAVTLSEAKNLLLARGSKPLAAITKSEPLISQPHGVAAQQTAGPSLRSG
jgi:hypothetical protein